MYIFLVIAVIAFILLSPWEWVARLSSLAFDLWIKGNGLDSHSGLICDYVPLGKVLDLDVNECLIRELVKSAEYGLP